LNGNGVPNDPALAVLGRHTDTGKVRMQIQQVVTGTSLPLMTFSPSQLPVGLTGIEDLNDKAGPELAVLSVAPDTGSWYVYVHDARDGTQVIDLPMP
jgi:hypothetical protein